MTLGNMRANGVPTLAAWCLGRGCNHYRILDVSDYADDVPVPSFGSRLVCTVCGTIGADARPNWQERAPSDGQQHWTDGAMALNQWQYDFLRRLVELGSSITVPDGVVNQELIELIEADYVVEGSGGSGRTRYEITEAGRAASKTSLGE